MFLCYFPTPPVKTHIFYFHQHGPLVTFLFPILKIFSLGIQVHHAINAPHISSAFSSLNSLTAEMEMIYSGNLDAILVTSSVNC